MSTSSIRSASLSTNRLPVSFSAHGDYFVSGCTKGIQVWRVEDGHLMATITVEQVQCVAFSKDGKWIAAGTYWGEVMILDTKVYKPTLTWNIEVVVRGVDFSPDSARLVAWGDQTTTIWNVTTRERVLGPLRHEDRVWAARYSPQGNQIAAGTQKAVRIMERNVAPVDIPVQVATGQYNTALLWSNKHIFVVSDGKIKQIDASTRSVVAEWPVPDTGIYSCIAMPKHGQFITYSANRTVTFWDTSTHTHLGVVEHTQDIYSIALSQDGRSLAIGSEDGKITIKRLSRITEPDIDIGSEVFHLWRHDQLANVDASLTEAISAAQNSHQVFAIRALVRARLHRWEEALADAKQSIGSQSSIMGFVAKSVSLVGKGKKHEAYRACDIAFQHSHPTYVNFLLLIKAVVVCMAGEHSDAISRVDDLMATLDLNSICYIVQAYMHFLLGNARMESGDVEGAIRSFKRAQAQLRPHTSRALSLISLISGWNFDDLDTVTQRGLCEALYAAGRTDEAGESLLKVISSVDEVAYALEPTAWVSEFLQQYLSTPGSSEQLLKEWARSLLTRASWRDALVAAITFMASRFTIYQTLCEQLDTLHKISDATECLHQMMNELQEELNQHAEQMEWVLESKRQLREKLEYLGDGAMHARRHDEAISRYSAALTLDPASRQGLLIKRSRAYVARGLWRDGLNDADEVIEIDSSSPWGYERKHAALHKAERYDEAIGAFETMLLKISQSPDSAVRERHEYVNPAQTKIVIRKIVQDTIRGSPRVLIHTPSGRLLDKHKQAVWFESLPVFQELVSSMTTRIDHDHIQREVTHHYRYAAFSHTWEDNEPLFEQVIHVMVYDLDDTFTHNKLRMFCKIARDAGLYWAWSDTCCINKSDHFILQEALVAMFKWYEGSAVTIVFLRGVHSPSQPGDLMGSIWNTRAWTFQEYHASKVVRFYTEEWAPYMNLDIPNHKDSPTIIAEMEKVTGISARSLMALHPGLEDIREKLCLASGRETTFIEDAAYSLLGIFSASLPIVYGEGDQALSRLLAQLLTSSGDTSILAWTGKSGTFNSCLPSSITVFKELPNSHIPSALTDSEIQTNTTRRRPSSPNLGLILKLYDELNRLPVPSCANQRMKLPCLTFKLGKVLESASWSASEYVFRAKAEALGVVEIRTTEDLSRFSSLTLVHPWIDFLLDRQPVGILETTREDTTRQSSSTGRASRSPGPSNTNTQAVRPTRTSRSFANILRLGVRDTDSVQSPEPESLADRQIQALRFISRLRQPFGALLFTPNRLNVEEYKRVASETSITVQVEELSPKVLNNLIDGVHILDVL